MVSDAAWLVGVTASVPVFTPNEGRTLRTRRANERIKETRNEKRCSCEIIVVYRRVRPTGGARGVDPYGTGGTRPPNNIWTGGIITNVPLNISRVISATFYPCDIFFIS